MKAKLHYRGDGFEATKEIEIPLIFTGMDIGISLDEEFSSGVEIFTVKNVTYLSDLGFYEVIISKNEKFNWLIQSTIPMQGSKLTAKIFQNSKWEIRENHTIKPN